MVVSTYSRNGTLTRSVQLQAAAMDSHIQLTENSQENAAPEEQTHQLAVAPVAPVAVPPFATASFSHFTPFQHAIHSFRQHRSSSLFASPRPTQASSLAHLSLSASASASASTASPARISCGSTISANPLQSPLTLRPRRALDPRCALLPPSRVWPMAFHFKFSASLLPSIIPSKLFEIEVSGNADPGPFGPRDRSTPGPQPPSTTPTRAAGPSRRASIVWFRSDLRVHDNECLNAAHNESISVFHLYCVDLDDFCKSAKSNPIIASFLLDSLDDLHGSLQAHGLNLVVGCGRPEEVLADMARAVGAEAVYAHCEVSQEEVESEERVKAMMKEEGVEVKYFWGSTLFHVDDLPFNVKDTPTTPSRFRDRVQGVKPRKMIDALDQLQGSPKRGDVKFRGMLSLEDLRVILSAFMAQDVKPPPKLGGETEALQRLKKFTAECQAQQNKGTSDDNINGVILYNETLPWLWLDYGCISPRAMYEELKNVISAASKNDDGGSSSTGPNWLMDPFVELDFLSFFTKRYSSPVKQGAPACTGALV